MASFGPKIAFHGGLCCGIKTIHRMGYNPKAVVMALEPSDVPDYDQYGHDFNTEVNIFCNDAPEETAEERVDRYLKFLDAVRPYGIIEIILADDPNDEDDQQRLLWEPVLLERRFVMVTDCYNSNSGNRVYVYHRKTDKED